MKAVLVVFALAVVAMAAAKPQGVNVVDNSKPEPVKVVDGPGQVIDSAFYRPSNPGYEPISIEPAFVENPSGLRPTRPGKQYDSPWLRGGKGN